MWYLSSQAALSIYFQTSESVISCMLACCNESLLGSWWGSYGCLEANILSICEQICKFPFQLVWVSCDSCPDVECRSLQSISMAQCIPHKHLHSVFNDQGSFTFINAHSSFLLVIIQLWASKRHPYGVPLGLGMLAPREISMNSSMQLGISHDWLNWPSQQAQHPIIQIS